MTKQLLSVHPDYQLCLFLGGKQAVFGYKPGGRDRQPPPSGSFDGVTTQVIERSVLGLECSLSNLGAPASDYFICAEEINSGRYYNPAAGQRNRSLLDLFRRLGIGKARPSKTRARRSMERTTGHVVRTSRCVMLPTTYLLNHIEALLRLSHDAKDRAVSAKLREMADEFRIMVSVADITDFAAEVSQKN